MSSAPLMPGYRIGDYELVHELGRGAIGETFAARGVTGPRAGQLVCLKVLAQEFRGIRSAERDAAVRYLRHEARVVSQLDHPNIARLLDSGSAGDVWYLAFELVDGANLCDVLAHGALGANHVMHVGLELSKALACAHERDVLHRDVKPSNILISTAGEVKLVDFGLAKLNVGAASQFSQHVGTPRYFAPEQLRGDALTPATDIYALGLVMFELLTGSHPFYSADVDVFRRNVLQALPQRSLRGRDLPRELVAIVERCIEHDSAKRFISGTVLHNALRAAIDQCSRAGDGDLRELGMLRAGDASPDSQAETRIGDVADRVADIRDEGGDGRTRFVAEPMQAYANVTRVVPSAETAARAARTISPESESIMGDLSRIARAVTEQRSSGLEPAQPHRSGVRALDEATPLQPRPEAESTGQRAEERERTAIQTGRRWPVRSAIAMLCVLLATAGAAVMLLRPWSQLRAPAVPAASVPASAATGVTERHYRVSNPATTPAPPAAGKSNSAAPTVEAAAGSASPSSDVNAIPPPGTRPKAKHVNPSRAESRGLVSVTIGTIPYGQVIVDGKHVGSAPVEVKLAPGPHRIIARAQQLRRIETVVVSPETNQVVLDLRNADVSP